MSKLILAAVGVLFGVNTAMCAVDWSTVTGEYEVPEGASEVVTDADIPYVNALTKLTVNGAVRFDTTTPPTMPLEGAGVCSKTNDDDWTMSVAWANWKGTWTFDGGKILYAAAESLGSNGRNATTLEPNSEVYVNSGATLEIAKADGRWIQYQRVHIAGAGKDGQGAIVSRLVTNSGYPIGNVTLEDDATICIPDGAIWYMTGGNLELNGHKLSIAVGATGRTFSFGPGMRVIGPGEIDAPTGVSEIGIADTCDFQFCDSMPRTKIVLHGNKLNFALKKRTECSFPLQYVDIEFNGACQVWHSHAAGYRPTDEQAQDDCGITFVGDLFAPTASDGVDFNSWISGSYGKCPFRILGDLSGAGTFAFPTTSGFAGCRHVLGGTNSTNTGKTAVRLGYGGTLELRHPKSTGGYSGIDVDGGHLALGVGNADPWTTNDVAKLLVESTRTKSVASYNDLVVGFDASVSTNGPVTVDAGFWQDAATSTDWLGACGGVVSITGPLNAGAGFNLAAVEGTLRVTGDEPIIVKKAYSKTANFRAKEGVLLFDGASDVTLASGGAIYLPYVTEGETAVWDGARQGRMVVSNSTIRTPLPDADWGADTADRAVNVGYAVGSRSYPGVLEFGEGADFTGKLIVGRGANDQGAVFQTGGTVRDVGQMQNGKRDRGPLLGNAGHGYYELRGGTYTRCGRLEAAYAVGSSAVFAQFGGNLTRARHPNDTAGWSLAQTIGNGYYHHYVAAGSSSFANGTFEVDADGTAGRLVVTVDGANAYFGGSESAVCFNKANAVDSSIVVNLNAGVFEGAIKAQTADQKAVVFANGGTWRMPDGDTVNNGWPAKYGRTVVMAGGLTIDGLNSGASGSGITMPFDAPTGKGVVSVELPAALADETFVGAPAVEIFETGENGAGFGATAIAIWDRATGKVTGIRVTGAGDNYTVAEARIYSGAARSWTAACTLAENAKTGGLRKTGSGIIRFCNPNTYGGATIVEGGTILAACDYAIPSNGVLVLNGGSVDLAAYAAKFAAVGGTGGSLVSKTARTMEFESPIAGTTADFQFEKIVPSFVGDWTISAAELLAGTATAEYDADVTFGSEATVTIDDFAALDTDAGRAGSPYVLFKVTDGKALTGMPTWTNPPADGSWTLRRSGNAVKLLYRHGMMLLVR